MNKVLFAISLILLVAGKVQAQGLPPGECGLKFSYDATGSLIKREYICNNTGEVMNRYGSTAQPSALGKDEKTPGETQELIKVTSIAPNPTTGVFTVTMARSLQNVSVTLLDGAGSMIEQKRMTGSIITFNISNRASGVYYVKIYQDKDVYTFKVVKQ